MRELHWNKLQDPSTIDLEVCNCMLWYLNKSYLQKPYVINQECIIFFIFQIWIFCEIKDRHNVCKNRPDFSASCQNWPVAD